jgi:glucose-6-phosphate 1-epimerase
MPVERIPGANGLSKLKVTDGCGSAEAYLHGAHVTSWIPAGGEEILFLSKTARWGGDASIRGGIPVIFPQFSGRGPLPKHGFARVEEGQWSNADTRSPVATLELRDSARSRAIWPHAFAAALKIALGIRKLSVELSVRNTGDRPFEFTAALHTYLRVGDIGRVRIRGLQGTGFQGEESGWQTRPDTQPEITFPGEIDRVYVDAPGSVSVHDDDLHRVLQVTKEGFSDVVVWNPGPRLAAGLADLGDEYRGMVCVEAVQAAHPVVLEPGARWQGSQTLEY